MQLKERASTGEAPPTASIGLAILDPTEHEPESIDSLMRAADEALYRAKAGGRNRVTVA
ncbi:MAG TPA: diguanylate cyclase [Vicinamibacterales bacterium]|jgi:PleD family two-component response regulator|nr:diguanylate cyclase [Vicinamibacterales bacterium]